MYLPTPEPCPYFQVYQEVDRWYWQCRGPDHAIIAVSGVGYETKAQCLSIIQLVRKRAEADIEEGRDPRKPGWSTA